MTEIDTELVFDFKIRKLKIFICGQSPFLYQIYPFGRDGSSQFQSDFAGFFSS